MKSSKTIKIVMEMITYISLVLYMFDVVLLGTGELTKSFGIQSRMIFFGISVLAAVVLILLDLKKYLNNKYLISVLVFMVVIFIAAIRGFVGKQNTTILLSDFKGFLNFLIVFPMMAVLYKKNRVISFLKMLSLSLGVVSVLGIILAFYLQMPLEMRRGAYDFFDGYNICMITELTGKVTRIFFNSGSRLFFAGFALSIVFSLIENKRKIIWIFIASLDIFGVFISYTRSGYLAFVIGIFAFVVLILLFYRDFFKTLAIRACFVGGIVVVLIGMVSVAEKVNLVDVAINRCLFAGAEIEDTNTNVEKPSDNKNDKNNKNDKSELTNKKAEIQNLAIREQRKTLALENIKKHPLFGGGLGVSNDINDGFIEYFYLDILSKIGFIGFIIFIIPFLFSVFDTIILRDVFCKEQRLLALAAQLGCLFVFVISYFNPCLNSSVGLFMYSLALVLSMPWENKKPKTAYFISSTNHYNVRTGKFVNDYVKKGYDVIYVTSDFDHMTKKRYCFNEYKNSKQLHVISYKKNLSISRILSHLMFSYKTFYMLLACKPELVYVEVPNNSLVKSSAKYKKINNAEIIVDVFDMWPESMPVKTKNMIVNWGFDIWRNFRNKNLKFADQIWIECDYYRELLSAQKINLPMETKYLKLKNAETSIEMKVSEEEIDLCYLGSINNIIDISLIEKIVLEFAKNKRTRIHIIGDGERKDEFLDILKKNSIEIIDHGKVYEIDKLQEIFDQCWFGINVLREDLAIGITMKSISYFRGGLPIINTVQGDTSRFVEECNIGINVDRHDVKSCVLRILNITKDDLACMKNNTRNLFEQKFAE
uniref:O-antigen ligase family protein n=1 Tax=Agathobacter rectalis TaxID=39491 RepID=UPI00402610AC